MTRIKVCGLTRAEDVDAAIASGVDFLGFNLWRGSSRRLEPHDVRALVARVPTHVISVGVFVHGAAWDPYAAEFARVTWVQIHGVPDAWTHGGFARPVIRGVPVAGETGPAALRAADYWILDRAQAGHGGGGKTFAWSDVAALAGHPRVFLAGGLTPDNVADAIRAVRPYAVDVASGCESAPGKKDAGKIRAFVQAVKDVDRELGGS